MRTHRLTTADWKGYAVLTIVGGVVGIVAVLLPWANDYSAEHVNFSVQKATDVVGVLSTQWGPPVLVAAIAVVAAGIVLLVLGPRLLTMAAGALVVVAGIVFVVEAVAAADSMIKMYRPGLGLYITLLTGILLVPIGLVATTVGQILRREAPARVPPGP